MSIIEKMKKLEWIPQFPDGSGWDTDTPDVPTYYYEHITKEDVKALRDRRSGKLFKVVGVVDYHDVPHKNTYFVKGDEFDEFFVGFSDTAEEIVSVEEVDSIPDTSKKYKG